MSLSDLQGKASLPSTPETQELPEIIPNSTLQLDGDISCYYSAWTDMSLGLCIDQLKKHIEMKRLLAGCEIVNVHTTHGSKAGREDIAKVNPYQDDRKKHKDPEKSARVKELRQFLQTYETQTVKPVPQFEVEADDSMNIFQRIEMDLGNYSAIMTKDKDLNMCPGNHFTYDTVEHYVVPDGYGKIWLTDTKPKKITGIGTSFFWAQTLMGDSADSIPGLPQLTVKLLNKYKPTKAIDKALALINNPRATYTQKSQAQKALLKRNPASIGAVTAYEILKDCTTDKQAFDRVLEGYREYYGRNQFEFTDWRGNTSTETAASMLLEQAKLLWMLRTWDDNVSKFFLEKF